MLTDVRRTAPLLLLAALESLPRPCRKVCHKVHEQSVGCPDVPGGGDMEGFGGGGTFAACLLSSTNFHMWQNNSTVGCNFTHFSARV